MSGRRVFAIQLQKVRAAITALIAEGILPAGIDQSRLAVEPSREVGHGDLATNAAMVLAKEARSKPRQFAEQIAAKLRDDEGLAQVAVAGPEFINLTLTPAAWIEALHAVLHDGPAYGASDVGRGTAVNVEYVSSIPQDLCTSATAAAPCSATLWRTFLALPDFV